MGCYSEKNKNKKTKTNSFVEPYSDSKKTESNKDFDLQVSNNASRLKVVSGIDESIFNNDDQNVVSHSSDTDAKLAIELEDEYLDVSGNKKGPGEVPPFMIERNKFYPEIVDGNEALYNQCNVSIILPGFKEIDSKKSNYYLNHYFIELEKPLNNKKERYISYYQKSKELEIFNQIKTNIKFDSYPELLRDGKFYTISEGLFTMYNDKFYNKLYEIKFNEKYYFISTILLDNNDLIFACDNVIMVYRLKNGKYFLFQNIDENQGGYEQQNELSGCIYYPKDYSVKFIKEISGNRFICVSSYGFKLYSLNEKKEYSIVLHEIYYEGLKMIHEINENNFIFCTIIHHDIQYLCKYSDTIIIEKICLKEITKKEKEYKLNILEKKDYYNDETRKNGNYCAASMGIFNNVENDKNDKIDKKEVKNMIESLKFKSVSQKIFEYDDRETHYCNSYVVLKNKYFIIGIDSKIFIFDIFSGQLLKKYEILIEKYCYKLDIKKWNNKDDNKFLICLKEFYENGKRFKYFTYYCIILSELTEKNDLKLINQSYFTNINNIKNLNEKENKFYEGPYKISKKENKFYKDGFCISIF